MLYFAIIKKGKNKLGEEVEKISFDKSIDSIVKEVSDEVEQRLLKFEESKGFYSFPERIIERFNKEKKWYRREFTVKQIKKIIDDEWETPKVKRILIDSWNNTIKKFKKETIRLV